MVVVLVEGEAGWAVAHQASQDGAAFLVGGHRFILLCLHAARLISEQIESTLWNTGSPVHKLVHLGHMIPPPYRLWSAVLLARGAKWI